MSDNLDSDTRLAAKKAHPDQGGSAVAFAQLQGAMKTLEGVKR